MSVVTFPRALYFFLLTLLVACTQTAEAPVETATSLPPTVPDSPTSAPSETPDPTNTPRPTMTPGPTPVAATFPIGEGLPTGGEGLPWWNDTIFYEIFVRSFYDSDSDGIGDLPGLIEKLDYLNDGDPATTDDLGISGIWLMPITQSPSYHGYDVIDYYQVDDEYGSNEDFQRLIEEAHARGIRVIVDLVLNHTSSQHTWFQSSIDPDSEYRDWYVWSEEDPGYRGPWSQSVWHFLNGAYYYGVFWEGMPDLNYENPAVSEQMLDAARFWLEEMNADGFRLDAVKHIIEDGAQQENTDATHAWLEEFYTFYKGIDPDVFAVGEAWTVTSEVSDYTGDEVDVAFAFDMASAIIESVNSGYSVQIGREQQNVVESFPPGQYGIFLANHDQNRIMSVVGEDEAAARLAATWLLTSPGVPFLYYGEEIGMVGTKPDEDIRRPMQWTTGEGAGFTTGRPWRAPANPEEANVAEQNEQSDSLLNHYRRLIHLRNQHEALRIGDWLAVETNSPNVYAYLRHSDDEAILALMNIAEAEVSDYALDLPSGPLSTVGGANVLLGDDPVYAPAVNAAGGFDNYRPLDILPPQSSTIVWLAP